MGTRQQRLIRLGIGRFGHAEYSSTGFGRRERVVNVSVPQASGSRVCAACQSSTYFTRTYSCSSAASLSASSASGSLSRRPRCGAPGGWRTSRRIRLSQLFENCIPCCVFDTSACDRHSCRTRRFCARDTTSRSRFLQRGQLRPADAPQFLAISALARFSRGRR